MTASRPANVVVIRAGSPKAGNATLNAKGGLVFTKTSFGVQVQLHKKIFTISERLMIPTRLVPSMTGKLPLYACSA